MDFFTSTSLLHSALICMTSTKREASLFDIIVLLYSYICLGSRQLLILPMLITLMYDTCENSHCVTLSITMHNRRFCWKYIMFIIVAVIKLCINFLERVLMIASYKISWIVLFILTVIVIRDWKGDVFIKSNNHIILWWTDGFPGLAETITCSGEVKCDVYCDRTVENVQAYLFYGSSMEVEDLPRPRRPYEVIWGLYHEESPRNVEELMHEEMLNLFNFSATFSRYSDVPFPLQYLVNLEELTSLEFFVETSVKNGYLNEISPVMYLQTDCETSTERDAYVKELMKFINVDSYGLCLKNKEMPIKFRQNYLNNLDDSEFLRFVAKYKFVIAIENGVCDDYVTEKFWRALKTGTVPIYFGSPSIRDWFPNNKSAILIEDFPTPKILSDHLNLLLKNDISYEEYLEHKTKQIVRNERLIKELEARPNQNDALQNARKFECMVCQRLHKKDKKTSIVNKSHYNCPKPISALSLKVNPQNSWTYSWESAKKKVKKIKEMLNEN